MTKYTHFVMTDRAIVDGRISGEGGAFGPLRFGYLSHSAEGGTALFAQENSDYGDCLSTPRRDLGGYAHFFRELYDDMKESGKEALFFIHGYKHSFEQLKHTVEVIDRHHVSKKGSNISHIVAFSWPASTRTQDYDSDLIAADKAGEDFCHFLVELRNFLQQAFASQDEALSFASKLNLVTISMGSRVLEKAVECFFKQEDPTPFQAFNEVIMSAPDLDFTVFDGEMMPRIAELARRTHCHFNNVDAILFVSAFKNKSKRLGLSGPTRRDIHPQIIFLDTSKVVPFTCFDAEFAFEMKYPITHNYFLRHKTVVEDAFYIFKHEEAHCIPGRHYDGEHVYRLFSH